MSQNKYILFIDGVCNLCNNLVRFVFNFDKNSNFLFAPLFGKKYQETNKIISFLILNFIYSNEDFAKQNFYSRNLVLSIKFSYLQ